MKPGWQVDVSGRMHHRWGVAFVLAGLWLGTVSLGAENLQRMTWLVDGVQREALVRVPDRIGPEGAPLVFVFHGHGGSMVQAARSIPISSLWPAALVVYPQGLPTAGQLTDPRGLEAGWPGRAGAQADRDLRFFDVMLSGLRAQYPVDGRRIYATGHSNGGGFTYLLWAERGDVFAALAPSSAVLAHDYRKLKPKPLLHIGSPQDALVRFAWQARMIDYVLRLDGCGPRRPEAMGYTTYLSSRGTDVATYLHEGGHRFPAAATAFIVKFFQDHPRS